MVNGVYDNLAAKGLETTVGILADETSWLIESLPEYPFWLSGEVLNRVEVIVHHTYDNRSDFGYAAWRETVNLAYPNKPKWMTVCPHITLLFLLFDVL